MNPHSFTFIVATSCEEGTCPCWRAFLQHGMGYLEFQQETTPLRFVFAFSSQAMCSQWNTITEQVKLDSNQGLALKIAYLRHEWMLHSSYFGENILSDWLIEWSNTYLHMYHEEEDRRRKTIIWTMISAHQRFFLRLMEQTGQRLSELKPRGMVTEIKPKRVKHLVGDRYAPRGILVIPSKLSPTEMWAHE